MSRLAGIDAGGGHTVLRLPVATPEPYLASAGRRRLADSKRLWADNALNPGDQGHYSSKTVVCGATSSLGVSVVALDQVSSSIIDHCAVSSEVGGHQPDD